MGHHPTRGASVGLPFAAAILRCLGRSPYKESTSPAQDDISGDLGKLA